MSQPTLGQVLIALSHLSPWHADRARRLFTCGCPKQTVIDICSMDSPAERNGRLAAEEKKLSLDEMAMSQSATPMEKLQGDLAHAHRVIERMDSRERWYVERIEQLEAFSKRVAGELGELRSAPVTMAEASSPKLTLHLGDTSLPDHERMAKKLHESILNEDGIESGMTPVAPLLPIPTHSLQKAVSWSDLSSSAPAAAPAAAPAPAPAAAAAPAPADLHMACILRGGGAGTHDDCPYCNNGRCTCEMDTIRERHKLGPMGEATPVLLPCPASLGDAAFANCSPFIRDLYKAGLFHCPLSSQEKNEVESSF
jgi:hypothetical protein